MSRPVLIVKTTGDIPNDRSSILTTYAIEFIEEGRMGYYQTDVLSALLAYCDERDDDELITIVLSIQKPTREPPVLLQIGNVKVRRILCLTNTDALKSLLADKVNAFWKRRAGHAREMRGGKSRNK